MNPRSQHCINPSRYDLVLSVFVFKDTLFNRYCSFMTAELAADKNYSSHLNEAHLICICSRKIHHNLLVLRIRDRASALCLGALLNSEITKKKHKNMKTIALNRSQKEHFFAVCELNRKARSLRSTSAGNMH